MICYTSVQASTDDPEYHSNNNLRDLALARLNQQLADFSNNGEVCKVISISDEFTTRQITPKLSDSSTWYIRRTCTLHVYYDKINMVKK